MRMPLLLTALAIATPAAAQSGLDGRVGKLESEMRAVQRKVFPGGAIPTIEPQITPQAAPPSEIGSPASTPLADLTQRVSSLEGQMATMTGQIEQAQFRLRQLEEQFAAYKKDTDAKIGTAAPLPVATPAPVDTPAPAPAKDSDRAQRVAAVQKPDTSQPDEDGYLYGYRLWDAKLYPEAIAQLKKVVADYPRSRRASFAQNLVGRAYLDDGKPSLAAISFYDNYKKMPDGERAPDSLFYLGQALTRLKKPAAEVCKVYDELTDVYAGKLSTQMQADVARARASAKCK